MTTVVRDPRMFPVFTGTSAIQLRTAVRQLIEADKADAEKLERMNHWAEARVIWHEIHQLERLLEGVLLDRLASKLKENAMTAEKRS